MIWSRMPPLDAHAVRRADEHDRDAHRHRLAGDEFLEVDVENLLLERMALDLADQRLAVVPPRSSSMTVVS